MSIKLLITGSDLNHWFISSFFTSSVHMPKNLFERQLSQEALEGSKLHLEFDVSSFDPEDIQVNWLHDQNRMLSTTLVVSFKSFVSRLRKRTDGRTDLQAKTDQKSFHLSSSQGPKTLSAIQDRLLGMS